MEKDRRVQYFVTFALSLATVTMGVSSAWPTPVLPKFKKNGTNVDISEDEISTMLALSAPGFVVGSIIASFISDTFGRKMTVLTSAVPFGCGTLLAAVGTRAWMLYIMKFLWGFGTGLVASNMEKDRRVQYFVTFALSLATVTMGVSSAWPTPVLPKFKKNGTNVDISEDEISTMLALSAPGFVVGSIIASFISDTFGRKMTVLTSAVPFGCGTLLAAVGTRAWMLYIMKFLWGFGTGLVASVVNIYLAEVADKEIRASLSTVTRFMFNFGSLLIISIGTFMSYSSLNYTILALPLIFFTVCLWIPETPQYYLKEGKIDKAKRSLTKLNGSKDIENRLETLKLDVSKDMKNSTSPLDLFRGTTYWRPITIAAGLKVAQIMTGAITIQQYLGRITQDIDTNMELSTHLIIFGVVKFVVGIISSLFADRVGRRPMLISSFLGTAVCLTAAGTYFFLQEFIRLEQKSLRNFRYVPFVSIILSNVISSMGFNAIISVIQAEIFPLNVRAIAMTCLNILGGFMGFLVPKCYQKIKYSLGLYGAFWFFSCVAVFGAVFSYFMVPETKGKSLREIQDLLQIGTIDVSEVAANDVKVEESIELMEKKEDDLK